MRLFKTLFVFGFLGLILWGCDGGGGGEEGGFTPTGNIVAVAERSGSNVTIKVGGTENAVPPGSTVEVTNLSTGETQTTTAADDGSFDPTFMGSTSDMFNVVVSDGETIVTDITIGVTIISQAVTRNIAGLGSVPTAIEIRGSRAYVLNGFSDNIQIFDLDQNPPQQIETIVLPPSSDPVAIAFLDDTRAYVANMIGQSVALVNVETRQCELLIVRSDSVPSNASVCQSQVITVKPQFFEGPSGIAIANGKVYVTNINLDEFFEPVGNGFITVIDSETNQVINPLINATGQGTGEITFVNDRLYVVNGGDADFDTDTGDFFCDPDSTQNIDVINPQNDTIEDSIPIPLSSLNPLACNPNRVEPTPDGRFGYLGSGVAPVLFKVDLQDNTLVRGADNPIVVTPTNELDATFDVEIRDDGFGFIALFNSDQIAVLDTEDDSVNPFPFIAPFPAGLRADDPDSEFFDGIQDIAIRDDGSFPDVFFITGISNQLGSINTESILPPE